MHKCQDRTEAQNTMALYKGLWELDLVKNHRYHQWVYRRARSIGVGHTYMNDAIAALNPPEVLFEATNYWQWLKLYGTEHRLEDHKAYLRSLGFIPGKTFLDPSTIAMLRGIHHQFYWAKYNRRP